MKSRIAVVVVSALFALGCAFLLNGLIIGSAEAQSGELASERSRFPRELIKLRLKDLVPGEVAYCNYDGAVYTDRLGEATLFPEAEVASGSSPVFNVMVAMTSDGAHIELPKDAAPKTANDFKWSIKVTKIVWQPERNPEGKDK